MNVCIVVIFFFSFLFLKTNQKNKAVYFCLKLYYLCSLKFWVDILHWNNLSQVPVWEKRAVFCIKYISVLMLLWKSHLHGACVYHFVEKNAILKKWLLGFDCRVSFWHRSEMLSSKCYVLFGLCVEFWQNEPNFATSVLAMCKNCKKWRYKSRQCNAGKDQLSLNQLWSNSTPWCPFGAVITCNSDLALHANFHTKIWLATILPSFNIGTSALQFR